MSRIRVKPARTPALESYGQEQTGEGQDLAREAQASKRYARDVVPLFWYTLTVLLRPDSAPILAVSSGSLIINLLERAIPTGQVENMTIVDLPGKKREGPLGNETDTLVKYAGGEMSPRIFLFTILCHSDSLDLKGIWRLINLQI